MLGSRSVILTFFVALASACAPMEEQPKKELAKEEIEPTAITLNNHELTLARGSSETLTYSFFPEESDKLPVSWHSSDTSIVKVADGIVYGIKKGQAEVIVESGELSDGCVVTVVVNPSEIILNTNSLALYLGATTTIEATVLPLDVNDTTVVWTSSDSQVVSVDESGVIRALSEGKAIITATCGEISSSCSVTASSPLSMEALENGIITINNPLRRTYSYSINGAQHTSRDSTLIEIKVVSGDVVALFGSANSPATDAGKHTSIQCSSPCYIFGNVMSLYHPDNLTGAEEIYEPYAFYGLFKDNSNIYNHPEKDLVLSAIVMKSYCYAMMFYGCTGLTSAPELPATSLADHCYLEMFERCTALEEAPELPAVDLAESCYSYMFSYCSALKSPPALHAVNLEKNCCFSMFQWCTSLSSAPVLKATKMKQACYECMFYACYSLTSAPELPATVLAQSCYNSMFYACTSLKNAPALPATNLAPGCYAEMFADCTGLTTAPALPATTLAKSCYAAMFRYCINLTTAPVLPAKELKPSCYYHMFRSCKRLNYIKALFTSEPSFDTTGYWVEGVSSSGTFVMNKTASWDVRGVHGIPVGWDVNTAYN